MQDTSTRNFILLGMTVCLLLPFLALSWLNYDSSRRWAREEITQTALPLTRDNIYSEIYADLTQPIYVSTTMANDSFLQEWAAEGERELDRITRYLAEIHRKYGYFSVFFVSAKTHTYYHYKGRHKVVRPDDDHDVWFFRFVEMNKEYDLDVDTDEAGNNKLTIFLNFRVEDEAGNLLGVTGVGLKMDTVSRLLETTESKYRRRIYLVNRKGVVQAHADQRLIDTASIRTMPGIDTIADSILGSLDRVVDLQYESPAGRVYLTTRYMPDLEWFLVVEQNESTALANARMNFWRTLLFGGAIWIALVAIVLLAAQRYRVRLEAVARMDSLTGLANRRRLVEEYDGACSRHARSGEAFVLMLMDLDGFKEVNDTLGHLAGDLLLKQVAAAMTRTLRPSDHLARWGGDEFLVLAFCDLERAANLGERIREAVREEARRLAQETPDDPRSRLTVSCGVVAYRNGAGLDALVHRADELLYRCKQEGGDRVRLETDAEAPASETPPPR